MTRPATQIAKRHGIIFILSAPSGAGKTTLYHRLRKAYPEIKLSVSCTTRARRKGEVNGQDYRFITVEQFEAMKSHGEFAEWASVHGNSITVFNRGATSYWISTFRARAKSNRCIPMRYPSFSCHLPSGNCDVAWPRAARTGKKSSAAGSPMPKMKSRRESIMITTWLTGR